MNFYKWITNKYLEWQKELGERKTILAFAEYLGVNSRTVTYWMQPGGKVPRSTKSINRLVDKFGLEVYEVLGLESPSDDLFEHLPEDFKSEVKAALAEMNQRFKDASDAGIELSAEETRRIIFETVSSRGFSIADIAQ